MSNVTTKPVTFKGSHAPWDDVEYTGVPLDDLAKGRIIPADLAALKDTVQFLAYELYCQIANEYPVPVLESDVERVSERYQGDPLEDLAFGANWHPSEPVEVAWALSLLAQEVTGGGMVMMHSDMQEFEARLAVLGRESAELRTLLANRRHVIAEMGARINKLETQVRELESASVLDCFEPERT